MALAGSSIVVVDSSVVVNFLRIERLDLFAAYSRDFIVTDHVVDEIAGYYPEQQAHFEAAQADGTLRLVSIADPEEVARFVQLTKSQRLGEGECSAIACAVHRGYALAIDDRQALNHVRRTYSELQVLTTQDLVVSMIQEDLLDVSQADAIKREWAKRHRFKLAIRSFAEVIQSG